ncbi:phosphatase PAP2 family protein [Aliifodinibius sp. S!AR15-10]|uniref:phosphatase PAP2 family protein n=1 Tax=Aliifodinibius sp. S!AR15-10 TaxID=2950437 RepID=UPI002856A628|nr:phosphatase PAP2 family protein [Aliifodinibius sp. S!AR15-10]MDR8394274.1 phosphatase PAP2 family protein [Aliifodinibius sp. S!AR15-10]
MISFIKHFTTFFVLFVTVSAISSAQSVSERYYFGEESGIEEEIPRFLDDFRHLISSPARINQQSLNMLGSLSAATAAIMIGVDAPVYRSAQQDYRSPAFNVMTAPGRFYDVVDPSIFALGSSGLLIGSGYLFKDKKMAKTGWTAIEAVVFTQLATGFLKSAAGRERPFVEDGNMDFDLFDNDGNAQRSFPSGHTSKIFALSTVLASSYDSPWVRIPAYALAASVALQRVESGEHWVSDVVVGGTLGYVIGRTLAKQNGLVKSDSRVYPVYQGGMVGLNIRF